MQIIEYTHSGTNVKIYDKSVPSEFIDFDSLRVGHLYYIILDKGTDQINLPGTVLSGYEKNYVTDKCYIPPTPTPTNTPTDTPTPTNTPTDTPTDTPN